MNVLEYIFKIALLPYSVLDNIQSSKLPFKMLHCVTQLVGPHIGKFGPEIIHKKKKNAT